MVPAMLDPESSASASEASTIPDWRGVRGTAGLVKAWPENLPILVRLLKAAQTLADDLENSPARPMQTTWQIKRDNVLNGAKWANVSTNKLVIYILSEDANANCIGFCRSSNHPFSNKTSFLRFPKACLVLPSHNLHSNDQFPCSSSIAPLENNTEWRTNLNQWENFICGDKMTFVFLGWTNLELTKIPIFSHNFFSSFLL